MRTRLAPRESEVQRATIALYRGVGCTVLVFSEGRKSRIPCGWPDLVVFLPLTPMMVTEVGTAGLMFFHETKSATGRLSADQEAMHDRLRLRGQRVLVGGEREARDFLRSVGLLKEGG